MKRDRLLFLLKYWRENAQEQVIITKKGQMYSLKATLDEAHRQLTEETK